DRPNGGRPRLSLDLRIERGLKRHIGGRNATVGPIARSSDRARIETFCVHSLAGGKILSLDLRIERGLKPSPSCSVAIRLYLSLDLRIERGLKHHDVGTLAAHEHYRSIFGSSAD